MTVPGNVANGARRGGRPTKEEARQLGHAARDAALRLFLDNGYEATSMDAIAAEAGTTKATLYARFGSKEAIFRSVVEWATARNDWPEPEPDLPDPADLEGALREIARAAVRRGTHPAMLSLMRIAVAEADRFPDLARHPYSASPWPREQVVADLLERHAAEGAIVLPADARVLAELFLGMVCTPVLLASFGSRRDPRAQEDHTEAAVQLFLRGLRAG
jgi:AcrR family transcriptional regulator